MTSQLSLAPESSVAQVASSPSQYRRVFATFHRQDRYGRNNSSPRSLVVPADETCEEWLLRFEDLALEFGKTHHSRDVAITFRFDGLEKKPTVWEYLQNFLRPVFGLRYVDIGPTW